MNSIVGGKILLLGSRQEAHEEARLFTASEPDGLHIKRN